MSDDVLVERLARYMATEDFYIEKMTDEKWAHFSSDVQADYYMKACRVIEMVREHDST